MTTQNNSSPVSTSIQRTGAPLKADAAPTDDPALLRAYKLEWEKFARKTDKEDEECRDEERDEHGRRRARSDEEEDDDDCAALWWDGDSGSGAGVAAAAGSAVAGAALSSAGTGGGQSFGALAAGAGLLGIAAIANASSGNDSSIGLPSAQGSNTDPIKQGTETSEQPSGDGSGANPGTNPGGDTPTPPTGNTTPPADIVVDNRAEEVAADGTSPLTQFKSAFSEVVAAGTDVQYIRILSTFAAENTEPTKRVVRWGDDSGQAPSGMNLASPMLKGPEAAVTGAGSAVRTAYEVIQVEGGLSREEAEKWAEALGGKLMVIDDASEASWIASNLYGLLGEHNGTRTAHADAGAWIGGNNAANDGRNYDGVLRGQAENTAEYFEILPLANKLNAFVVEYSNYQWPLLLQSADGQQTQLENGSIISKEDFDKLFWDSAQNRHGVVTYEVVDSDDPATARRVAGTGEGKLVITEVGATPELATYAETQTIKVGADTPAYKLDSSLFKGTGERPPQYIKITAVHPDEWVDGEPSPLSYTAGGTTKPVPEDGGVKVAAANFGGLSWDASTNAGGKIFFIQTDEHGRPLPGAKQQTIVIEELIAQQPSGPDVEGGADTPPPPPPAGEDEPEPQPSATNLGGAPEPQPPATGATDVPPSQPSENEADAPPPPPSSPSYAGGATVAVGHDQTSDPIPASTFLGNGTTKAEAIKITAILDRDGQPAADGALLLEGQPLKVSDDTIIQAVDFNKLSWDASQANDGSFKFKPVTATGADLSGSSPEQTVTIDEADAEVLDLQAVTKAEQHNATAEVAYNGTSSPISAPYADVELPAYIRIDAITITREAGDSVAVRTLNGGAQGNGYKLVQSESLALTRIVAAEQAKQHGGKLATIDEPEELEWLKNAQMLGDRVATDASEYLVNGLWIGGGSLDAANGKEGLVMGSDQHPTHAYEPILFDAEGSERMNAYLVEYDGYSDPLHAGAETVKVGTVLVRDAFDTLTWNSLFNNGGSIQFSAVDGPGADAQPLSNTPSYTLTISELPKAVTPPVLHEEALPS